MRIALLEVVAMQGGHEVEFDRLIVQSLRTLEYQPVFLVPSNFSFSASHLDFVRLAMQISSNASLFWQHL